MKCIISGEELQKVMSDAVNILCDTVSATLGPTGNNILIHNSEMTPFITNDGVTIASNIESEDNRINAVLEIVKEASIKTNELVGDGTTTTLVLLQSIFNLGLEEIRKGKNKIVLKNELLSYKNQISEEIKKLKRKPLKEDLLNVATTSSNDYKIGKLTAEIFQKVKSKYSIKLEESNNEQTYSVNKKGYSVPIHSISSMYFSKKKSLEYNDVKILLLKGYLESLERISDIINDSLETNKNLLIFVEDMNEQIKNEILVYYMNHKNIFIVELEEYSSHRDRQEEDIAYLSSSTIKNIDYEQASFCDLGNIDKIIITQSEVVLFHSKNSQERINKLQEELKNCLSDYEKEFINERISKLENGITTIYVGGTTKSEKRERLMRFEDAICALESAKGGFVPGEGITYLKVSEKLENKDTASLILKKSLEKPFEKIIENLGLDYKEMKNYIRKNDYGVIYDYTVNDYIPIQNSKIIDSTEVLISAFGNALSISSILLSTSSLIINDTIIIN